MLESVYRNEAPRADGSLPGMAAKSVRTDHPFGAQWTFRTFFASARNYLPAATAQEIARVDELLYNPFVVCGRQGTGKTHLLRAIANELCRTVPVESIYFGSIEHVSKVYTSSSKEENIKSREFFYPYKVFIIDDLHQVKNSTELQEEIINIFDHFYDNKKQMIFSCGEKISSDVFVNQKLKSRIKSGLIVNLYEPEIDIRIKYIQSICRSKSIKLAKDQMLTLAQRYRDIRSLQGVLLKIQACKRVLPQGGSEQDWTMLLEQSGEWSAAGRVSAQDILDITARELGVPVTLLLGSERSRKVVYARQMAMFLCRTLLGASFPELGRLFGNKDHSTVMYAVKKIHQLQQNNHGTNELVTRLLHICRQQSRSAA